MSEQDFSFKWFARHPFYRAINAYLVDLAGLQPGQRVVELACGTGAVTRLILEKVRGARESAIIAVDHSAKALREAVAQFRDVRDAMVQFVQTQVEGLGDTLRERADAVVFCNGIHYVQDKARLLAEVAQTLKPGGVFAFNTSFFQGAHPPETEQFYRRWMYKAIRIVRSKYGLMPKPEKVEARRQLTPEQYRDLVSQAGLQVQRAEVRPVEVPLVGWLDISRYEDFIRGALPGIPLDKASKALQEGVTLTFQEMGLKAVPRNWLSVVAVKTA